MKPDVFIRKSNPEPIEEAAVKGTCSDVCGDILYSYASHMNFVGFRADGRIEGRIILEVRAKKRC